MSAISLGRFLLELYRGVRLAFLGQGVSWRRVPGGVWMRIDARDYMDREFFLGTYERALTSFIGGFVRRGDVCVDVGAHKGYVAFRLARAVGPTGRVIAIEPDPRAMAELSASCERNKFGCMTLLPVALSDQAGDCEFVVSSQLGFSSRFPNEIARPLALSTITVRTESLDGIVRNLGIRPSTHSLSFVKIDAEGSEPLILRGMTETLAAFQPVVWMEVNLGSLRAAGYTPDDVEAQIRSLGYRLYLPSWKRDALLRGRLSIVPIDRVTSYVEEREDMIAIVPRSRYEDRVRTPGFAPSH